MVILRELMDEFEGEEGVMSRLGWLAETRVMGATTIPVQAFLLRRQAFLLRRVMDGASVGDRPGYVIERKRLCYCGCSPLGILYSVRAIGDGAGRDGRRSAELTVSFWADGVAARDGNNVINPFPG